jgi:hypothetical protein
METERKMPMKKTEEGEYEGKKTCFYHSHLFWSGSALLFNSREKNREDDAEDRGWVEVMGDWVRE